MSGFQRGEDVRNAETASPSAIETVPQLLLAAVMAIGVLLQLGEGHIEADATVDLQWFGFIVLGRIGHHRDDFNFGNEQ